jgi:hypothetical protein
VFVDAPRVLPEIKRIRILPTKTPANVPQDPVGSGRAA